MDGGRLSPPIDQVPHPVSQVQAALLELGQRPVCRPWCIILRRIDQKRLLAQHLQRPLGVFLPVGSKMQISAGYTTLTSFYAEYDVYANCLPVMGYDPRTTSASRYYAAGASSDAATTGLNSMAVNTGAPSTCRGAADINTGEEGWSWFKANKGYNGVIAAPAIVNISDGVGYVMPDSFQFQAAGFISDKAQPPGNGVDDWIIDQNTKILHLNIGY